MLRDASGYLTIDVSEHAAKRKMHTRNPESWPGGGVDIRMSISFSVPKSLLSYYISVARICTLLLLWVSQTRLLP